VNFYGELANDYDNITGLAARSAQAAGFIEALLSRSTVVSGLDVACGTGLYAIQMAKKGIRTIGTDISAAMLDRARKHAEESRVDVEWLQAAMQELSGRLLQLPPSHWFCIVQPVLAPYHLARTLSKGT
jgi:2-polyprenyl-3-methyl-5-hydroxy-6-metoxy-1,4-benzoquinol methylase